ncbi:MAG: relaxase/mobilization nuclease domain-containing protein [Methylacidiphilales bacterium]|nr:relaxase/mobilization nuclease domain-containing protein [Candidatus Methylacidiphilales bacterium]
MLGRLDFCTDAHKLWRYIYSKHATPLDANVPDTRHPEALQLLLRDKLAHISIAIAQKGTLPVTDTMAQNIGRSFIQRYAYYAQLPDICQRLDALVAQGTALPPPQPYPLDAFPYAIVRHHDTNHEHIHIALGCYGLQGERIEMRPTRYARRLMEVILRQLEREMDLPGMRYSWEIRAEQGKHNSIETWAARQIGGSKGINTLKQAIKDAMAQADSWEQFRNQCQAHGIELIRSDTPDAYGKLAYKYRGIYLKPRQLGEDYGWQAIEQQLERNRTHQRSR